LLFHKGSVIIGLLIVGASSIASQTAMSSLIYPYFNSISLFKPGTKHDVARVTVSTCSIYALVGLNLFQTTLPSSVITLGAYAKGRNLPYPFSGSVQSTSPVATSLQRKKIQRLGLLYGCHHCGSRQLISRNRFIADHMPPTKQANEMNKAKWRKWFRMEVIIAIIISSSY
jgi:hypothetical protein